MASSGGGLPSAAGRGASATTTPPAAPLCGIGGPRPAAIATVAKYSWSDEGHTVKVYVQHRDLMAQSGRPAVVNGDSVRFDCSPTSLTILFHDQFRLHFKALSHEIHTEQSRVCVAASKTTVRLVKQDPGRTWVDLERKHEG